MSESQLRFLQTVLLLNKYLVLGFLFVIQFCFLILGKIFHRIGLISIFIESRTIGGAILSDLLFVEPSIWIEKIMKKVASLALSVSGTKI